MASIYDKKGELNLIDLHRRERAVPMDSDDEIANEFYKWYAEMTLQGEK